MWNNLPNTAKCKGLLDFKDYTNQELKPPKYKHFGRGKKLSNTLLTQIRVGRSHLNQHKFTIGLSDSPQCLCLHREESTLHYFVDCFLYSHERQILFSKIEHHIPNFKNYSKKKKIDLILRGYNPDNVEFTQLNTTLTFNKIYNADKKIFVKLPSPPTTNPTPIIPVQYPSINPPYPRIQPDDSSLVNESIAQGLPPV